MAGRVLLLLLPRACLDVVACVLLALLIGGSAFGADPVRSSTDGGFVGLLSSPLPGTQDREDADLSRNLQQTVAGFDGVASARVVISRTSESHTASPHVAVQVTLEKDFSPTATWLDAVRVFILRTVPHLAPNSLTVVDSTGQILLDGGEMFLTAEPDAPSHHGLIDETFNFQPWWLWAAGGIGFLIVIAGVLMQLSLRRDALPSENEREPGPFDFLDELSDERVVAALTAERPAVVGVVMAAAPEAVVARLRRCEGMPSDIRLPLAEPDPVMTAALARVLRERLVGR